MQIQSKSRTKRFFGKCEFCEFMRILVSPQSSEKVLIDCLCQWDVNGGKIADAVSVTRVPRRLRRRISFGKIDSMLTAPYYRRKKNQSINTYIWNLIVNLVWLRLNRIGVDGDAIFSHTSKIDFDDVAKNDCSRWQRGIERTARQRSDKTILQLVLIGEYLSGIIIRQYWSDNRYPQILSAFHQWRGVHKRSHDWSNRAQRERAVRFNVKVYSRPTRVSVSFSFLLRR